MLAQGSLHDSLEVIEQPAKGRFLSLLSLLKKGVACRSLRPGKAPERERKRGRKGI
jgi:hypothetical protein